MSMLFFDTSFSSTLSGDIRVHRAGSQLKIPHLARVHSTRIMQDHNQSLFSFHKVGFVKNICLTSSYYYHKLDFIQSICRTSSYYFAQSSVSEKSGWAVNHKFFRNTALWKIVRRRSADILYEVWFMKELWFTAQPDFSETLLYEKIVRRRSADILIVVLHDTSGLISAGLTFGNLLKWIKIWLNYTVRKKDVF